MDDDDDDNESLAPLEPPARTAPAPRTDDAPPAPWLEETPQLAPSGPRLVAAPPPPSAAPAVPFSAPFSAPPSAPPPPPRAVPRSTKRPRAAATAVVEDDDSVDSMEAELAALGGDRAADRAGGGGESDEELAIDATALEDVLGLVSEHEARRDKEGSRGLALGVDTAYLC